MGVCSGQGGGCGSYMVATHVAVPAELLHERNAVRREVVSCCHVVLYRLLVLGHGGRVQVSVRGEHL